MDAVKTGTTVRLEEVRFGDEGEKAYYNVCLSRIPHPSLTTQYVLTRSAANMKIIEFHT